MRSNLDTVDIDFLITIQKHPKRLGPNVTELIKRYYGLDGFEPHSFAQLGRYYGRHPERMRQVLYTAMRRVRHPYPDELTPFEWPQPPPIAKDWRTIHRKKPPELRALIVRAKRLKAECYPPLWVE